MSTTAPSAPSVQEPFPIFQLASRYLLYDANTVTHARQHYNICGVLIGSLPQAPQQNVFLGLPLELMPEEARLLVEKGVAHIVDDVPNHKSAFLEHNLSEDERKAYHAALRKQGVNAARDASKRTDDRKKAALKTKLGAEDWNDIPADMLKPSAERARGKKKTRRTPEPASTPNETDSETLFSPTPPTSTSTPNPTPPTAPTPRLEPDDSAPAEPAPYPITPTTTHPPIATPAPPPQPLAKTNPSLPPVPPSYPLFTHLHNQNYFMTPGLRFGCQYTAYPGDPLRFHSHFLCSGMGWDEEFALMDLVGGGRLGTGVKKGFLVGGREEKRGEGQVEDEGEVRAFCVEWGGM